ncbi:MAG: ornithine cyclodeaminase family protein [Candidatus Rokuibacteriota bacterium]
MLVLSRADLERLLPPHDVIAVLDAAFRRLAGGGITVPPRSTLEAGGGGVLLVMPARAPAAGHEPGALGIKLVTVHPGNRARGAPTIQASYVLLDDATGTPLALLEGTFLTQLRTGATSALAARHLARRAARRAVCFGAGPQAGLQLRCLAAVLRLERVEVVGRDPGRARAFVETMRRALGIPVVLASDARAAVREADVVTCATTSPVPVVFGADLRPGVHVDAVGAFRPAERELDTDAVRRARVVVDTYAGAWEEAGDVLVPLGEGAIARGHVVAELAELVAGRVPGRTRDDEITLFKSVGFALEDLAAARLAYNRAVELGMGVEVAL